MTLFKLTALGVLSLGIASAGWAQRPPDAVSVEPVAKAEVQLKLEEAVSLFLLEALRARGRLRNQGLESRADRLWGSAAELVRVVREADREDSPMFLPLLDDFRRTLAETMASERGIDQERLAGIQEALDDQISIHTSPGAFPDAKGLIRVAVRTLRRDGQPVNGLYVSLDLVGAVPNGKSANELLQVTSPARGAVGPGRYLVRVRSGAREVARRDIRIGRTSANETIDVVLE